MRFSKLRAEGRCHIVVNTIDSADDDWKRLAAMICAESSGVSGDQLAVISHRGRANFDLRCFEPDGSPEEADAPLVACAAMSIRRRYGYHSALLRGSGRAYWAEITGETVSVRPWSKSATDTDTPDATRVRVAYLFEGELIR